MSRREYKTKLALVISSLRSGGAERVMVNLANYWAGRGDDVTLITLDAADNDFYKASAAVQRVGLDLRSEATNSVEKLRRNVQRVRAVRKALRNCAPDVVLSFVDQMNVVTLIASVGLGVPVIVSERTDPRRHRIGHVWDSLRRLFYRNSAALVLQSAGLTEWGAKLVSRKKLWVIPNAVAKRGDGTPITTLRLNPRRIVLSVGRLTNEKGFDLLIRAFAKCQSIDPVWILQIIGEGANDQALRELARELGVAARVEMPGEVDDVNGFYDAADLFVLSSRYEGFPNVLLEAMSRGLAVISVNCQSGPSEIVTDGVNGLLVPVEDVDALADAMARLMRSPDVRAALGQKAVRVAERFSSDAVFAIWDELVVSVIKRS